MSFWQLSPLFCSPDGIRQPPAHSFQSLALCAGPLILHANLLGFKRAHHTACTSPNSRLHAHVTLAQPCTSAHTCDTPFPALHATARSRQQRCPLQLSLQLGMAVNPTNPTPSRITVLAPHILPHHQPTPAVSAVHTPVVQRLPRTAWQRRWGQPYHLRCTARVVVTCERRYYRFAGRCRLRLQPHNQHSRPSCSQQNSSWCCTGRANSWVQSHLRRWWEGWV